MYGGGLHLRQWSNGIVENNKITGNGALIGPGIHVTYSSSPQILSNEIENNAGGSGAALYIYYLSEPNVVGNLIRANSATNSIIGVHYSSTAVIKNNLITQNTKGPAILCTGGSSLIRHNTIIENENCGVNCSGISTPYVENNIIASTHSGYGVEAGVDANPTIRYNNIWNNGLGNYGPNIGDLTGVAGNISSDPHFLNEPNVCFHLNYTSACIDAGDPNFVPVLYEVDFDGDLRVLNSRTDIGADEAKPVWNLTKQSQYTTIQDAIDDANDTDDILAIQGRYFENINIKGKSIKLHSLNPMNWQCVENTIIDGNQTDNAVVTFAGTEDVNCVIAGMTITDANNSGQGGGIAGNGTAATLSFCRIANNTANQGGGIYDFDGLIKNCKIFNNTSGTFGGGLSGSDDQIYNCFITNNRAATYGGGFYGCDANIINDTIAGNTAGLSGGGLELCPATIANCIVWANTAPNNPDFNDCSQPKYSCFAGASSGQGNIDFDPQFVDANNDNYHLSIYSDCIDAGDNNSVPEESIFDIDKEVRVFAFDTNGPAVVDIGADEVVTSAADFNDDGIVDYWDFMAVTEDWLISGEDLTADLAADEFIDFADYAVFANDWLWQAPWHTTSRESALKFDSSSGGYVWIHTPEGCILNNVFTFTYTAWIYPLNFSQINARIIGKNERAFMTSLGGALVGYSHGGGTAYSNSDLGLLKTGKWHFVMMIYDYYNGDKKVHLYIDGNEVSYQVHNVGTEQRPPLPDWRAEGEWDLVIGTAAWSHGSYVPNAIIDEVAIYDRVLTQEEIDYLYNNGLGRPTPSSLNPIGLWHFDEREGTAVLDSSGNNNHGVLQGTSMPVWTNGRFLEY
jgi:parallel beta-helix repeat protein